MKKPIYDWDRIDEIASQEGEAIKQQKTFGEKRRKKKVFRNHGVGVANERSINKILKGGLS